MSKTVVATTANNKQVYVDTEGSHAATHLLDTPNLLELVKELLTDLVAEGENIYLDKDMGRIIGTTDLIETTDADKIRYAKRPNRTNYTRFVLHRQATPTPYVTIVLRKNNDDTYDLWSAWIGRAVPQFPGDKLETPESRPFWRAHALVWGNQAVQLGSERETWPWG